MFDEDMENHMGTIGAQYMSYDRYPKTSYKSGFGSTYITVGAAQKTHDFANSRPDLIGSKLHEYMKQAARGFSRVSLFGEELPSLENRIELISDKDAHGMPLARLVHSFDDDAVALWRANIEEGQRALKAAGAKEAWAGAAMPTSSPARRHHHGHRCGELGGQQLRPDPRDSQSLGLGAGHLPDRRRLEPDLYDPGALAARRRPARIELGLGHQLIGQILRCSLPASAGRYFWRI